MSLEEIEKYYNEHFDVVFDYAQLPHGDAYRVYDAETKEYFPKLKIKDEGKKCRFCQKTEPQVRFKNVPHSISETLGNKTITGDKNECDSCNSIFSGFESDLTNFLLPYLILNGIRGKNGMRTYKTLDGSSRLYNRDDLIKIEEIEGFTRVGDNPEKHEITYTYYCSGFRLQSIYKILVKIALSLLPEEEFNKFKRTAHNIVSDNYSVTGLEIIRFTTYTGLNIFPLVVRGYLRKGDEQNIPNYIFYLCCGNFTFQVPILTDREMLKHNKGDKLTFDFFELDDFNCEINGHKPTSYLIDCASNEVVSKEMKTITLHYDKKVEVPPTSTGD